MQNGPDRYPVNDNDFVIIARSLKGNATLCDEYADKVGAFMMPPSLLPGVLANTATVGTKSKPAPGVYQGLYSVLRALAQREQAALAKDAFTIGCLIRGQLDQVNLRLLVTRSGATKTNASLAHKFVAIAPFIALRQTLETMQDLLMSIDFRYNPDDNIGFLIAQLEEMPRKNCDYSHMTAYVEKFITEYAFELTMWSLSTMGNRPTARQVFDDRADLQSDLGHVLHGGYLRHGLAVDARWQGIQADAAASTPAPTAPVIATDKPVKQPTDTTADLKKQIAALSAALEATGKPLPPDPSLPRAKAKKQKPSKKDAKPATPTGSPPAAKVPIATPAPIPSALPVMDRDECIKVVKEAAEAGKLPSAVWDPTEKQRVATALVALQLKDIKGTTYCRVFTMTGMCRYADGCSFSHSQLDVARIL
jgi:hypothetical protein